MKRSGFTLIAVAMVLFGSACGTVVNGTSELVTFSSEPQGATITVDNLPRGTTPTSFDLSRKAIHTVRMEKTGYLPYQATINQSSSDWIWGDVLAGGIFGLLIDAASGGMYDLQPTQISAKLEEGPAPVANAPPSAPVPVATAPPAPAPVANAPSAAVPVASAPSAQAPVANAPSAQAPVANAPSAVIPAALASDIHPAPQQGVSGQGTVGAIAPSR